MITKSFIRNILTILTITVTSGCASIVSKSNWPVTFNSTPPGGEISIFDKSGKEIQKGTTPTTLTLPSSSGYFKTAQYTVEIKMNGYSVGKGTVNAKLNGWYIGNIVFGGLIGILIVDPATGAMYKLPENYTINLSKTTADAKVQKLEVCDINSLPEHLKSELIKVN